MALARPSLSTLFPQYTFHSSPGSSGQEKGVFGWCTLYLSYTKSVCLNVLLQSGTELPNGLRLDHADTPIGLGGPTVVAAAVAVAAVVAARSGWRGLIPHSSTRQYIRGVNRHRSRDCGRCVLSWVPERARRACPWRRGGRCTR